MTDDEFVALNVLSIASFLFINELFGIWFMLFGIGVILYEK